MSTVAIVGTGKLGTRLAEQLVMNGVCSELLLWNRSMPRLHGTLLSLQLWAHLINKRTEIRALEWSSLHSVDVVVIAVKEHYDPRTLLAGEQLPRGLPLDLRHIGIQKDLPLVKEVCNHLTGYRGKVVVVTNPVDLVSSCVTRWLPGAQVFGAGITVDAARLAFMLSKHLGNKVTHYECLLAGEHGANVVPLKSMWRQEIVKTDVAQHTLDADITAALTVGFQIVEDLGYTLQDCAAVFAQDISWLLGRSHKTQRSALSVWDEVASIGWPIEFNGESIVKVTALSEQETLGIRAARSRVASSFEIVNKSIIT